MDRPDCLKHGQETSATKARSFYGLAGCTYRRFFEFMTNDLILLVQANEAIVKIWLETIHENNISKNILVVHSVDAAIDYLYNANNSTPGLILLDMGLPEGDGVRFLHRVKRDLDKATIPVVSLVMDETRKYVNEALEAGADGYIVSAVDSDEHRREIEKLQYYWSNLADLARPARTWPDWISKEGGDAEPPKSARDFVMLVQSEPYLPLPFKLSIYQQLMVMRVEQVSSMQLALSFLFSSGHTMPKYIILDLALPPEDIKQFMRMKNQHVVQKEIPVIGLVSDKSMSLADSGVHTTLQKAFDETGHLVNITWMETFWNQPERLKT
jgi:CheY-like chemotaxis protein